MNLREQILEFIDKLFHPLLVYEILQIKTELSIELISRVMKESGKTVIEAVWVYLTVVRYLSGNSGSLQEFIKNNADLIYETAVEKRAQSNIPGRALPLFDILAEKMQAPAVSVIELGASYGLIGRCLLNPAKIVANRDSYFPPQQQMPVNPRPVDDYLGIELSPPDTEWLLAWEWHPGQRERLKNFLQDIGADEKFTLLKGSAFGFSRLEAVGELVRRSSTVVVLTSFMLYQYDHKQQRLLTDEILQFTGEANRHWINQTFDTSSLASYIEFDGQPVIELVDGSCKRWQWVNKP
jgi:hypothetical protein